MGESGRLNIMLSDGLIGFDMQIQGADLTVSLKSGPS